MRITRWLLIVAIAMAGVVVSGSVLAHQADKTDGGIRVPENAIGLEGTPAVRIEATQERVSRQELDAAETAKQRLRINIEKGRYVWASRGNLPLTLSASGEFTYLASSEPGKYVRFQRVNDRITYVEHVDMALGSVTYWGELRIVLGK